MGFFDDASIIQYIDSLPSQSVFLFSTNFISTDLKHYVVLQCQWIETEKYLLGTVLNREPTEQELIDEWISHFNSERFRAFYVLKFPDKVCRNSLTISGSFGLYDA